MRPVTHVRRLLKAAAFVGVAAVLVGVPLAASANPDIDGFELDGNAAGGGANDWDALGNPLEFTGFIADSTDDSDRGYHTGGSKDNNDISQWDWENGTVTPAKNNIANAYAAVYAEDGNLILYFGQNRLLDREGDANVGFWFLQNEVGFNPDGTFSGTHSEGDVLVQSEFTNGGDVSGIRIGKWTGGALQFLANGAAECENGKLGTKDACATVNGGDISTSWAGTLTSPYFFEGGLNLSALFPQQVPCFSTFLTNTRTSQSTDARLKDFALGSIDTCASLTITKQATPSDGTQFGYSTTGGLNPSTFSLGNGGSRTYTKLQPGSFSVTEAAPSGGWALDSLSCPTVEGPGTSAQVNGATASITLGFVGHVECTYVNKRKPQVKVVKVLEPAGDPGKFDLQINGTTRADDVGNGGDTGFHEVLPGQVSVGELAGTGTTLANYVSSVSCNSDKGSASGTTHSFSVEFGDLVTCTITNQRKAKILIEKQTNPDGAAQVFAFTASYDADGFSLSDGQQNDSGALAPGAYSVAESVPSGWTLQSGACDDGSNPTAIALGAGETVKCTFTNVKDGQVVVRKVMDGGSDSFEFTGTPAGTISQSGGTLTQGVVPGQYVATEAAKAGWTLTSVSCSDQNSSGSVENRQATFNVEAGETVTCTFTNTKQSKIVVEKQTTPDGDSQGFAFTANYDADGFSLSDGQQNDSGPLGPGTYSVSETVPAGWDQKSAVCSDGSSPGSIKLAAGETVTCVFANEKDARIVVKKQTLPDGDTRSFHFDASYDEGGFNLVDGQQIDSGDLAPGTYEVSEDLPAGWDLTSAVCSDESAPEAIELSAGEIVTCVFTNTKRGSIVVEKQTSPNGAGGTFEFTGDAAGSIADNGKIVVANLVPGTYATTEAATPGFSLTGIECDDANSTGNTGTRTATFNLGPGETVTCTFTNAQIPTVTGQGSIDVQKSADPTSLKEPGGPVSFTVTITNTSSIGVTVTNVVDSVFGDLDDTDGSGVFDVPINLAPGEKVSKTFQRQVSGAGGQVHANVVTASGTDAAGNPVSDSDDARVEITPRLIDLVVVKTATSPTPLNGIVNYTLTVQNNGPDTATNVQLADPAPSGIMYLTASPSKGTCNLSASLITCSLGNLAAGETATINVTARATAVGTHTNVATVTGGGGRETNPADNVDDAVTIVPGPFIPPKPKPKPKPQPKPVCLTLTVSPKMVKADGKPDRVSVKVTAGAKRVKGTTVTISGAGLRKSGRTNGKGMAFIGINPRKPGLITITALETNQRVCGPKRIGVVGVFLPPLTG